MFKIFIFLLSNVMVEYQNKSNGQTSNNLKNVAYRILIMSNDHGKIDIQYHHFT